MASDSDTASTEATVWLARLERGLQSDEGSQLRQWLQQPLHRDAIVEAAKLWHGADILAVLSTLVPVGFGQPLPPKVRRTHPAVLTLGVCLALLVALAPWVVFRRTLWPGPLFSNAPTQSGTWGQTVYTTQSGQIRTVALPDGSSVALNGHTRLSILFGAGLRFATLEYGEALFEVAPEAQRPFEVNAGGRLFRAPPSMFDVRVIHPHAVELLVLNGGVTVRGLPWRWPATPAEARLFDPAMFLDTTVGPLQDALLESDLISRSPITAANARARLNWRPEEVLYVTP